MTNETTTKHTCPLCSAAFTHGRTSNFIDGDGEPTLICGSCWDAAEGLVCSLCDRLAANYYADNLLTETEWANPLPANIKVVCYHCAWDLLPRNAATPTATPVKWDDNPDAPCLGKHCEEVVGNTYSTNQLCESCADEYNLIADPDTIAGNLELLLTLATQLSKENHPLAVELHAAYEGLTN